MKKQEHINKKLPSDLSAIPIIKIGYSPLQLQQYCFLSAMNLILRNKRIKSLQFSTLILLTIKKKSAIIYKYFIEGNFNMHSAKIAAEYRYFRFTNFYGKAFSGLADKR